MDGGPSGRVYKFTSRLNAKPFPEVNRLLSVFKLSKCCPALIKPLSTAESMQILTLKQQMSSHLL